MSATVKKKSDKDVYSQTLGHGYSRAVSNVPGDVSDEDALTGAWQRSKLRPKTAQELDFETAINLKRGLSEKIWRMDNLENSVRHNSNLLRNLKQELLYD